MLECGKRLELQSSEGGVDVAEDLCTVACLHVHLVACPQQHGGHVGGDGVAWRTSVHSGQPAVRVLHDGGVQAFIQRGVDSLHLEVVSQI